MLTFSDAKNSEQLSHQQDGSEFFMFFKSLEKKDGEKYRKIKDFV